MSERGYIPKKHATKAVDLLECAPTDMEFMAAWITDLPIDQAITVGMIAIADLVTRPFTVAQLTAALFALEARWAEAGALLKSREPFPSASEPEEPPLPHNPSGTQDAGALPGSIYSSEDGS